MLTSKEKNWKVHLLCQDLSTGKKMRTLVRKLRDTCPAGANKQGVAGRRLWLGGTRNQWHALCIKGSLEPEHVPWFTWMIWCVPWTFKDSCSVVMCLHMTTYATSKKLYSINKLGYISFLMQPHSTNMLQNSWTHCTRCAHVFWPRGKPSSLVVCVSRHSHKLEALRILSSKHLRHMVSMFTTMGIRPRNLTGLSLESSSAGFGWDGTRSIQEV